MKKTNIKDLILKKSKTIKLFELSDAKKIDDFVNQCAFQIQNTIDIFVYKISIKNDLLAIETGKKLRQLCSLFDKLFIIYGRADYTKMLDSDGIILDSQSYSMDDVLKIIHDDKFIFYYNRENIDYDLIDNRFDLIINYDWKICKNE